MTFHLLDGLAGAGRTIPAHAQIPAKEIFRRKKLLGRVAYYNITTYKKKKKKKKLGLRYEDFRPDGTIYSFRNVQTVHCYRLVTLLLHRDVTGMLHDYPVNPNSQFSRFLELGTAILEITITENCHFGMKKMKKK